MTLHKPMFAVLVKLLGSASLCNGMPGNCCRLLSVLTLKLKALTCLSCQSVLCTERVKHTNRKRSCAGCAMSSALSVVSHNQEALMGDSQQAEQARQNLTMMVNCRGIRGRELYDVMVWVQKRLGPVVNNEGGPKLVQACMEQAVSALQPRTHALHNASHNPILGEQGVYRPHLGMLSTQRQCDLPNWHTQCNDT